MKNTVTRAISDRPVAANVESIAAFINGELLEVLRQLRTGANAISRQRAVVSSTGNGAPTLAWESEPMPTNAIWQVTVYAGAISTSGPAQQVNYVMNASFLSVAGAVSIMTIPTMVVAQETSAACDLSFYADPTSRTLKVFVVDNGVSPMRWSVVVDINEAQPA